MRIPRKKLLLRILLWALVFAALAAFFYLTGAPAAALDERVAVTVLTEDGPVRMSLAEYLPRVIAAEMPVSFGEEALRAQAVAARSFVLSGRRHEDADVCTNHGCCMAYASEDELRSVWQDDYETNMAAVKAAAAVTDGLVLTYGEEIIEAAFHASSAGCTESSAEIWSPLPYLVSVDSPETAEAVPDLVTSVGFSPEELSVLLGLDADLPPGAWLSGTEEDDAGRVRYLRIAGQSLSGSFVRSALQLRSTAFTVCFDGREFIFTVSGYGHGVGMSQTGAKLLAADGWSCADILAHYYPGTELALISSVPRLRWDATFRLLPSPGASARRSYKTPQTDL